MSCRFVLELAEVENAVIVSNDQYRDLMTEKAIWKTMVEERLDMYILVWFFYNDHDKLWWLYYKHYLLLDLFRLIEFSYMCSVRIVFSVTTVSLSLRLSIWRSVCHWDYQFEGQSVIEIINLKVSLSLRLSIWRSTVYNTQRNIVSEIKTE